MQICYFIGFLLKVPILLMALVGALNLKVIVIASVYNLLYKGDD